MVVAAGFRDAGFFRGIHQCRPTSTPMDSAGNPGKRARGNGVPENREDDGHMLISPRANIALAHYPKTAGSSLIVWFREAFPDSHYVVPGHWHLPVREGLEQLGLTPRPRRARGLRTCIRMLSRAWGTTAAAPPRCDLRIIGVIREPFEMLISLFEYWRRYDFEVEPKDRLIQIARQGTFREFLSLGVRSRRLASYDSFFDLDGPAWPTTRLLDFSSLEPALAAVCEEFDLPAPAPLGTINAAPAKPRDVSAYVAAAGPLMANVRSHFGWYYKTGSDQLVRGRPDGTRLCRAA